MTCGNDFWADAEVIHRSTSDEGIDDGWLIHPYPQRWPWLLITAGVHEAIEAKQDGRNYDQKLVPLLMDVILKVRAHKPKPEEYPLILEHTVAGTVWFGPNEKGGLTVYLPSEH